MTAGDLTEQGIQAVKACDRRQGQALLTQALSANPSDARAWLWLAACMDEPERQRFCLEKAQALQPDNPQIRGALERLDRSQPPAAPVQDPGRESEQPEAAAPDLTLTQEEQVLPAAVEESAAHPPVAPRPPQRAARRRSCLPAALLLFVLAGLACAAIAILPGMTGQAIDWNRLAGAIGMSALLPPPANPQPASAVQPAAPATLALPFAPTWTPTPSLEPSLTPTLRPTLDWSAIESTGSTPLPSITPMLGYRQVVIGRSVEGRPIEVYRFGKGRRERMIIAGIHGGKEYNTIALADELIEHLGKNPDLVPEGFTLYILRALNPDGAAAGRDPEHRLNTNGVDLNRNFDTNWKSSWRTENCASLPGTAGSAPGSEAETKAVKEFLRQRKIEALIVYHSANLGIFPSGEPAHADSVRLAQAIAGVSDYAYPPMDTGCEFTGTLVDWAANSGIPAAVDLELNSETGTEFEDNLKVLELLLGFDVQRIVPTEVPTADLTYLATPTRTRSTRTPTPDLTAPSPTVTP